MQLYESDPMILTNVRYFLRRHGIKILNQKMKAVMKVETPNTEYQLICFIGVVNFYMYLWNKLSHMLPFLSKLVGVNS